LSKLIAYKHQYAELIGIDNKKFIIKTASGEQLKVRQKDFRLLHPEFTKPHTDLSADFSILSEFANQELSLQELSEWLFNEYTPHSAWQTYTIVEDGLHCYFTGDTIFIRPQEQVDKIKQKRALEAAERQIISQFVQDVQQKKYQNLNQDIIDAIKKVAFCQLKTHKIFKALDIFASPENALKFLHQINAIPATFNPYPQRYNILTDENYQVTTNPSEVLDLTHLKSYAIDNIGSSDADDAISIENDTIWVHIADVASIADDFLVDYAAQRISNLYLADKIYHMLPINASEVLALSGTKTALSISCKLQDDGLIDIQVQKTKITIINISYDEADNLLENELQEFYLIAQQHKKLRQKNGAFSINLPKVEAKLTNDELFLTTQNTSPAREMVAEFMVIAGRAVAQFASENNIPLPFITQVENAISDELKNKQLTLSEKFKIIKQFPRSSTTTTLARHHGMGLEVYVRITSPLRRFLDFIAHLQLERFLTNKELFSAQEINKFIAINNQKITNINNCVRSSNTYYKLLYLKQNPEQYQAVVISNLSNKSLVMIEKLALIGEIKQKLTLDSKIKVQIKNIDIYNLGFDVIIC
jgi:exoribonuclease-2